MKKIYVFTVLCAAILFGGCQIDSGRMLDAGTDLMKAASVSDTELKTLSKQMRAVGDSEAQVAGADSSYTRRLNRLIGKHSNEGGQTLNFKVYMTGDVNANATADGSIRVYSGLMDLMDDDELLYVLGHEIGHVVKGHSLKAVRVAYASSAAVKGVAAAGGAAGALGESVLGDLLQQVVNAQFSQSQENDADTYSMAFMKKYGYNTNAPASALRKLASLGSGGGGLLASHPNPADRAAKMEQMAR